VSAGLCRFSSAVISGTNIEGKKLEYAISSSAASAANVTTPNCSIAPLSIASEAFRRAKVLAGSAATLAHKLGVTRQALSQWEVVPMLRVLEVERITGIARHELRPDICTPRCQFSRVNRPGQKLQILQIVARLKRKKAP
jgi:DNA-binding transcriptional regulator YdaS (Cro superfamily)